jgi:hypothetical protein
MCGPLAAQAVEYQLHGFASQGAVLTDHYDFFGDSSDGRASYYELGLSGSLQLRPDFLVSAQGVLRDAGATDTGKPRLDLLLADYRFLSHASVNAGFRVGRVKNPMGFYNETRDVIFTRPSILLPQSVYNETQGLRTLLFSSDGAQGYATWLLGSHALSLTSSVATNRELDRSEKRLLLDLEGVESHLKITRLWNVLLLDEVGPWRLGYSYTSIGFSLNTDIDLTGDVDLDLHVVSMQWSGERLSLTAEYAVAFNRSHVLFDGESQHDSRAADGGYVQMQYRLSSQWSVLARYDLDFNDRSDRSGHGYATDNPGAHAYESFGRDLTLGASWRSPIHWGVWGEVHFTDGTLGVSPLENDAYDHRDWTMLMLMAAFRF